MEKIDYNTAALSVKILLVLSLKPSPCSLTFPLYEISLFDLKNPYTASSIRNCSNDSQNLRLYFRSLQFLVNIGMIDWNGASLSLNANSSLFLAHLGPNETAFRQGIQNLVSNSKEDSIYQDFVTASLGFFESLFGGRKPTNDH